MYATMTTTDAVAAAREALISRRSAGHPLAQLLDQVSAEAGVWCPEAAERAVVQAAGEPAGAVALLRVWASTLAHVQALPVDPADIAIDRRITAAFMAVPAGQWLGAAPELTSRILDWEDHPTAAAEPGQGTEHPDPASTQAVPVRAETPRVRDLLADCPIAPIPVADEGRDPAAQGITPPYGRATRLGLLARGETGSLGALAVQVMADRREAVLCELTVAEIGIRVTHPITGAPCLVATVPVSEAEVVLDAEVAAAPGFALGWGATLGTMERRAISIALLDAALTAEPDAGPLDEQTVVALTDASATTGFIEHLKLPHHASFASLLDRVREGGDSD